MAQLSAFFMLGDREHFYINFHAMYILNLYEDDRMEKTSEAFFIFRPQQGHFPNDDHKLIPNDNHFLDDAMLFLAYDHFKEEKIVKELKDHFEGSNVYDFRMIPQEVRESLYQHVELLDFPGVKILLMAFPNSSLTKELNERGALYPQVEVILTNPRS